MPALPSCLRNFALLATISLVSGVPALAEPTPIPGGADQAAGVSGTLRSPSLFNGQVRVKKMTITKLSGGSGETYPEESGKRWIVFRSVMSNGTSHPANIQQFDATVSDADGISVAAQPNDVRPMGSVTGLAPGAAWRENILFLIPSDFKPAKIVLVSADSRYRAFRITLAPDDTPAP